MKKTELIHVPVEGLNNDVASAPTPDLNAAGSAKVAGNPHKPRLGKRERAKKKATAATASALAAQSPSSMSTAEPKASLQALATKPPQATVSKPSAPKSLTPKPKPSTPKLVPSAPKPKTSMPTSKATAPKPKPSTPKPGLSSSKSVTSMPTSKNSAQKRNTFTPKLDPSAPKPKTTTPGPKQSTPKPGPSSLKSVTPIPTSKSPAPKPDPSTPKLDPSAPKPQTPAPKPKSSTTPKWKTAWMTKEAGALASTITSASLTQSATQVSSQSNFQTLCSYNWQNDGSIFVPGGPPKWTPPALPITLPQDSGHQFVDQNAYRVPKYPFEPAFQAMAIMNPDIALNDVDIIVNRNSLRKLLDFAAGKRQDAFCMGLHMVKDTLVISRKEMNARQMVRGMPNAGYGHNFEKAFTRADDGAGNSSSHHRVIRYHLGSLDCVVRFEVDAYYEDPEGDRDLADDITSAMKKLAVEEKPPSLPAKKDTNATQTREKSTKVVCAGTHVPASSLAEMKAKKAPRLHEAMPQLWFGRTPYYLAGKHEQGIVHSVDIIHAAEMFPAWETENQVKLGKMVGLMEELKRIAKGLKEGKGVLVHAEKGGDLKIFHGRGMSGVLPEEILRRHWGLRG